MARYYCDYCDARCSNNSASVRTQHNGGNLHRRNVAAFYSQFIGKDVQDKVDAIVDAFEAKVARGEVVPTYATFPRPVVVARAEKAKDGEAADGEAAADADADADAGADAGSDAGADAGAGADADADADAGAPTAGKRPRGDAGVEEEAAPDADAGGGGGGGAVRREEPERSSKPGTEEPVEAEGVGSESRHRDQEDGDGGRSDPAKKRRKLDGEEDKDGVQESATSEPSREAVAAAGNDTDAVPSLPSAVVGKDVAPSEGVAGLSKNQAVLEGGDDADDGSDMDMDG